MMTQQKWDEDQIPDLSGRVAIVTGSSSGIGWHTARALAEHGADVVLAVRNRQKGEKAMAAIHENSPQVRLHLMMLDLADLQSVQQFVSGFRKKFDRLDLLINNAGVMMPPYSKTRDGFELQMGTNHLGHFALTGQLLDLLQNTPQSRIVNVSSLAHRYGDIDFDDLHWEKRKYKAMKAYGDSKLANLYFTFELARRLKPAGGNPMVLAAHPGWAHTDLQRHVALFRWLGPLLAQDARMGALPTLYAAVSDQVQAGDFIGPDGAGQRKGFPVKVPARAVAYQPEAWQNLWSLTESLTKVQFTLATSKTV